MQTKRTTEPKVMTFQSFQISMCILFLSNQFVRTFCLLLLVDLVNLYEIKNKIHTKWTTEPKVMAFQSFQISMCILCLSNHLECSFSLHLPIHHVKMYGNEWSRCTNNQISKNLWPPEVRKLLVQSCATQHSNEFGSLCYVDLKKLCEMKKKMHPKRTTEPKVMTFRSFQSSMPILCQSNHLGCSFSI